jgi:hypothetical protein
MEQQKFNTIVDLLPYIVFGAAALGVLIILFTNWLIEKIRK